MEACPARPTRSQPGPQPHVQLLPPLSQSRAGQASLEQGTYLHVEASNRGVGTLLQYKLLPVDWGHEQGVIQRELCSKDIILEPGSMERVAR